MGHATRSAVVLAELVKEHEVHIVVSGRAREYLARRFENVHGIWGLTLTYEGNEVRKWQSVLENLKGAVEGWPLNVRAYLELAEAYKPELVISDFETFSYLFAKRHRLPVLSIDNIQIINRCAHDADLIAGHEDSFELTRSLVKSKLPGCSHYLITSFFNPPVRKERTTLVPPILRPEVIAARPEKGEHLLVYQTATTNQGLAEMLAASGLPCRVYGMRRDLREDVVEGSLIYRPFSDQGFIDDLRTARAVITGGGFTLMSEAVFLRKPVLSIPVAGQFEQVLNALYLAKLRYGLYARELTPSVLAEFLARLDEYSAALEGYAQDGNTVMMSALREQLRVAAEGRSFLGD